MTPSINAALVAVKAEIGKPVKNKTVRTGTYSFQFADLDQIDRLVTPVLTKHGLSYMQNLDTIASPDGILVGAQTILVHKDGERWESSWFRVPARDGSAQGAGGAATYAKRYSLCAALGIVADEDDDASPGATVTSRPAAAPQSARPAAGGVGASIMAQADGFDRDAFKRDIFAALSQHGITATPLRSQVMADAEHALGKKFVQFTKVECERFLGKARAGDFNYVLDDATTGSADIPVPMSMLPV